MKTMVNGEIVTHVDVRDRGLQYGDGLFETMAAFDGAVCDFDAHMARLGHGCRVLHLPMPDRATVQNEIGVLLDSGSETGPVSAVVKLLLTRGPGERGYAPPAKPHSNRILYLSAWPKGVDKQAREGIRVKFCTTRMGLNPDLAGIKHLNRLEQVLGAREIAGSGFQQGVMLDMHDQVVEATNSNVFMVEEGKLVTPSLDKCGVAGLARMRILRLASEQGITANIETVSRDRLARSDEVFLCNSIAGILPVTVIEQRRIGIGSVTRELQALLRPRSTA
ncbi:MAG: aminodeoxychorismate lyase [Gammaproteobacteria bacterium]|nr:aminodeoxychorismate lyase [Gammaproteobacteria bacterium]